MSTRYLVHFAHEHLTFRWTEFSSLLSKYKCKLKLLTKAEHVECRPYIICELEDQTKQDSLIKAARDGYLIMGLFELWGDSSYSLEHLNEVLANSPRLTNWRSIYGDQTFRVNCESFGSKIPQSTKVTWIKQMTFLDSFRSRPDLSNPQQVYSIFEMIDKTTSNKEYFFGRQLAKGDRTAIKRFSLKERMFIANTTMDPMLSLIAANAAKIKPNDLVHDPFVGSGSLLVAASFKGAFVMGADIDWQLLHGRSRPSRKGQKVRLEGEGVRANFAQYDLLNRYIDVLVSDVTRSPFKPNVTIDAIVSDPPYGIRECSEKIGLRQNQKPIKNHPVRYPSKTNYHLSDLLQDLLSIAARHLTIGGRLVYFQPVIQTHCPVQDFIPRHDCLELLSFCEQNLTGKAARLMVVMEKTKEPQAHHKVQVPDIVDEMNYRDIYFNVPNS